MQRHTGVTPHPYRRGDVVEVRTERGWQRAVVRTLIETTALRESLRYRVLYGWEVGHGEVPARHCAPDGVGRDVRPVVGAVAAAAPEPVLAPAV